MACEAFIERRFSEGSAKIIAHANEIIEEYSRQGFTLTLRQLYYQFVSRDLIANKQTEYKRLGSIVNDARLAGLIDWSAIEDRTRNVRRHPSWDSPSDIVESAAHGYAEDLWREQNFRLEVWIEKDALLGVVEPVCSRFRVPYFACRGYTSQSEQYAAGKRFSRARSHGVTPVVLHLGDHDPSGLDMTRDNSDRLQMFARHSVMVRRLALNWNQIEEHNPPPNPAKESDSRAPAYIDRFGDSSWELDALSPAVIDGLIESAIREFLDVKAWNAALKREEERRETLKRAAQRWDDVVEFLEAE